MSKKNNYENWSKEDLIREIKQLKKRKKYGIVWEDKPEDVVELCKTKLPVLKEEKDKEIITDKNKPVNLLIEGDNYHALSVLNYTHAGKIDVIYIDPPYNLGNKDFRFNDHYVDREDAYRHSKWLSFMERRLKLAKQLLKETGVIFVSIDDTEIAQLKMMMDSPDLFGTNNFIAVLPRKSGVAPRIDAKHISIEHDYVLCYAKNNKKLELSRLSTVNDAGYKYEDEFVNVRGKYKLNKLDRGSIHYSESLVYPIKAPDGTLIWPGGKRGRKNWIWRWSEEKVRWGINNKFIVFKKNKNKWSVYFKQYQYVDNEGNPIQRTIPYKSFILNFPNEQGNEELENIFHKRIFDYPKPVGLIKYLINLSPNKNAIVLDFFAGTGTTAHAVFQLNKEDGGNRQFILVTNNENNICTDVCYPRIKKVIEGYKNLKGEWVEGLGGNLKYFKTDFVDAEPTDRNKKKLTQEATEMLCVKENTFEKVKDNAAFKIFKNNNHYTGIIFDQLAIPQFKRAIKDIDGKFSVYIFSLTDETFDDEFEDIYHKVKLSPIPEAILRVYRRIFIR
ncbi:MAG: site-specific DNA-methyltransferase [candidate division WOR-3 bacterium]